MKVKSNLKKGADSRILKKENKQYGIINYDEDNCYPQRVLLITNSSPTAKACLDVYQKFIEGGGFKDLVFFEVVVNSDSQSADDVLSLAAEDLARFRGFALHCNITAAGKITEIYHVPFEQVRKSNQTKKDETGFDFAIYTDWNKQNKSSVQTEEIVWLNSFDPRIEVITEQTNRAVTAGIEYRGQLLYYSADKGSYPLASCDVVLESMFAEIQSDISTTNNIEQGFTKKGMFIHHGNFEEDEEGNSSERDEFEEDIQTFVGPEGEHVISINLDDDEEAPEYKVLEATIDDKMFQYTDDKVLNKIMRNWKLPKILLSVTDGGGYFNQEQVRDAVEFYNMMTTKERNVFEATFTKLGKLLIGSMNKTDDYSVDPITFKINKAEPPQSLVNLIKDKTISIATKRATLITFYGVDAETAQSLVPDEDPNADKRILADVLGVGGVTALQNILADAAMTVEQKKASLMIIFGLKEADANALAGIVTQPQNV